MIFERTTRFKRAAKKLTNQDRERLAKALLLYETDPAHPSLGIKRMQGTKGIWEGRASDTVRFTFQKIEGGILLRNVGPHDPDAQMPVIEEVTQAEIDAIFTAARAQPRREQAAAGD